MIVFLDFWDAKLLMIEAFCALRHPLAAVFLAVVLTACSLPANRLEQPTTPPVLPATATPFSPPTARNPTPAQPTEAGKTVCVAPKSHPAFQPGLFTDMPGLIAAFLNSGATTDELSAELAKSLEGSQPTPAAAGDFNGDGLLDIAVSILNPITSTRPQQGVLLVYLCQEGAYQLAYTSASSSTAGAPSILFVQDINADGKDELVAAAQTCGAHTCFENVQVLVWNGKTFENRLAGRTDDLPEARVAVQPTTEGGIADIIVTGGMVGSVGAGPQRAETRTWKYDSASGSWVVAADELAPSNFRIHAIQDADAALRNGDVEVALSLYTRVLTDKPPLEDFMDPAREKSILGAYAAFKIAALHFAAGESAPAQQMLDLMAADYPPGSPQFSYLEMAKAYQNALAQGSDKAKTCAAVMGYAQQHPDQVLDPLGPTVFGYANKTFTPADMCP